MTRGAIARSSILLALLLPLLGVRSVQAYDERPTDGRAFERRIVLNGTYRVLPDGREACCLQHTCVICEPQRNSCVIRSTNSTPTRVDPGSGGGLNGGIYSSQPPTVLQFGN